MNIKNKVFQKIFYYSNYTNIDIIINNKINIDTIFNSMYILLKENEDGNDKNFNSLKNISII